MKIVITGATGLIGSKIVNKLIERGDEAIIFTRSPEQAMNIVPNASKYVKWNEELKNWQKELEGVDGIIHLAGENVMGKRWNKKHKEKIYKSRIEGTKNIVDAISHLKKKPEVFISASAVGYYGNSEQTVDEETLPTKDFLANLVKLWEATAAEVEKYSVRRVSIRLGIVLDKNEGALKPLINSFNFFFGGPLGNGNQWFPWIHIHDVVDIFLYALDNKIVSGAVNACAPIPVKMNEFAKTLGRIMKRPSFFRVPSFILRIVIGEGAVSILKGANVQSKKIRELGYKFSFEKLEDALTNILKK